MEYISHIDNLIKLTIIAVLSIRAVIKEDWNSFLLCLIAGNTLKL